MAGDDVVRLWRAHLRNSDTTTKAARGTHNERAARAMQDGGNWVAEFSDDGGETWEAA